MHSLCIKFCNKQAKEDAGKLIIATAALLIASTSNLLIVGHFPLLISYAHSIPTKVCCVNNECRNHLTKKKLETSLLTTYPVCSLPWKCQIPLAAKIWWHNNWHCIKRHKDSWAASWSIRWCQKHCAGYCFNSCYRVWTSSLLPFNIDDHFKGWMDIARH